MGCWRFTDKEKLINLRQLFPDEEWLLHHLINNAAPNFIQNWKGDFMVKPMDDGGMGSLLLFPNGHFKINHFGKCR